MEYLIYFSLICSGPNKNECLEKHKACVEAAASHPSMEGVTKDEIALLLSQDGKTRKKLCK